MKNKKHEREKIQRCVKKERRIKWKYCAESRGRYTNKIKEKVIEYE